MIIAARELDMGTRDVAPQPGELVYLQGRTDTRRLTADSAILRVVAHWPVLGIWEVALKGMRKPEIIITVQQVSTIAGGWREVAGR